MGECWDWAVEATLRLLAARPAAEGARLVALLLREGPPERAVGPGALGLAFTVTEAEKVLRAAAGGRSVQLLVNCWYGRYRDVDQLAQQLGGQWNYLASCGPDATQTVFHLHGHFVPRRPGDGLPLPWTHPTR